MARQSEWRMNPTPGPSPLADRGETRGGNEYSCSKVKVHQFAPTETLSSYEGERRSPLRERWFIIRMRVMRIQDGRHMPRPYAQT